MNKFWRASLLLTGFCKAHFFGQTRQPSHRLVWNCLVVISQSILAPISLNTPVASG